MDLLVDQQPLPTYQRTNLVVNKNFALTAVDDVVVRSAIKYNCRGAYRTVDSRRSRGEKFVIIFGGLADVFDWVSPMNV
ncbi:hypothetical protein GQ600_5515 [Phytophthora cactorum]|nr:hypothetical protein GQ600_5515 [Phytophthora cactorum]